VLFPPAMRAADLETVFRIALPPLRLALRERYQRSGAEIPLLGGRLARHGWWN
jgi:hypothetical protein